MSMKQYLCMVNESSYGVTQTTSPTTTWLRLPGDDSFNMVPVPMRHPIRAADSRNRPVQNVSSRYGLKGKLAVYLYPTQAQTLLDWACLIDPISEEIPSYTLRFFDSIRVREFLGVKVEGLTLSSSPDSDEGIWKATFDLVGQKYNVVDPTLNEPLQTVFPSEVPYAFQESAGGLVLKATVGGSGTRTIYNQLQIQVKNILKPSFDENPYISDATYNGRDIDLIARLRFVNHTDRDNFEAQKQITSTLTLTRTAGSHSVAFDFKTAAIISGLDRTLPIASPAYETVHLQAFDDVTAATATDFSYVVA